MRGKGKKALFPALLFFMLGIHAAHAGIATTKHNLSTSGMGTVKAVNEQRICVFCHTPHHAISEIAGISVPLWNHTLSSASYQLYGSNPISPTLLSPTSPAIQPDGSSRLCLSCHDGTIAIGSVVNTGTSQSSIAMLGVGAQGEMPAGSSNYGTDLRGSHPVSIELNDALVHDKAVQCANHQISIKVCKPPAGAPAKLERTNNRYGGDSSGMGVQCSSCHDPHEDPQPGTTFFVRPGGDICDSCHATCADACP